MKYKRLTERTVNNGVKYDRNDYVRTCYPQNEYAHDDFDKMAIRLAELEDKIEQGTLIELPCKNFGAFPCEMGETVWLIYKRYWNVADKNGFWVLRKSKVSCHNKKRFSDDFGEFVFLTREEAEAKLKELQNGN